MDGRLVRASLVVTVCALAACLRPPPPRSAFGTKHAARIHFATYGQLFRVGVVRARVGGVETLAIVDTGAERHVISTALAQRLGRTILTSVDTTEDPNGRILPTRIVENVAIDIEGVGILPEQPRMVLDMPSELTEMGIGLILSPQQAVRAGEALRLDYHTNTLSLEQESAILGPPMRGDPDEARRCLDHDGKPQGRLFLVDATVDGEPVVLTVDTGSDATCLSGAAPLASTLDLRHRTYMDFGMSVDGVLPVGSVNVALGVGGTLPLRMTPSVLVRKGDVTVVRTVPILERDTAARCGQDGRLGLDILRSCSVTVTAARAMLSCRR